ncbi:alpha/beta fold hydrolase [Halobacteriovorax sp. HLS]|uniref:alpha/beta fold hydrolase n=1 Tax=Halobacteriovorax sp. HLS TaxID=2234000 RepID=UPI001F4D86D7|nr:alpha/beta fold hydrolase [Halobacteriovorax sp. HLS]
MSLKIPSSLKYEYPFSPKQIELGSGHKLNYVDEGQGPVVVMVHGNPTWSFYYRNVIKKLRTDFRVIVPDHIGCGLSDKPQDYDYTLDNHIKNLSELLDHLQIKDFSLIVHDWGGAIGMGLATRNPSRVNKAVILNTAAFTDTFIPKTINLCKNSLFGEWMVRKFNAFAWPATFMAVEKPLAKEIKEGYLLPYNNYANRIATARFVKDIPMKENHPTWQVLKDIEDNLDKVNCPKLLLWGEKDFCFNMHFYKRWKEIYPTAKSKTYPKAGHYILEDAKNDVNAEISSFLRG